jgi:hypothetical protein
MVPPPNSGTERSTGGQGLSQAMAGQPRRLFHSVWKDEDSQGPVAHTCELHERLKSVGSWFEASSGK